MNHEPLARAMWFVPFLFLATSAFGFLFAWIKKFFSPEKERYFKICLLAICCILGYVGVKLVLHPYKLQYQIHLIPLVIPFIFSGYLLSTIEEIQWKKYLRLPIAIIALITLVAIIKCNPNSQIDLAFNMIYSPVLFYLISMAGIYLCLYISHIITKWNWMKNAFSYIGRNSFDIMALHFIMFKLVDLCYITIFHQDWSQLSRFPYSYDYLWPIYIVAGIGGSLLICYMRDIIKKNGMKLLKNKIKKKNSPVDVNC